jgi:signal peptidase II
MFQKIKIPLLTVLSVLFIDQFVKIYIKLNYPLGEVANLGNWCILHFTENPGMAFGFEFGGDYGKITLSIFRILACIGGAFYIRHIVRKKEHIGFIFSVSLILAGAIGNILDSVFYGVLFGESDEFNVAKFMPEGGGYAHVLYGRVVDMFYFPIVNGHFPSWFPIWGGEEFQFFRPIFNFADFSISLGVGLIIAFQKRFTKKTPQQQTLPVTNSDLQNSEADLNSNAN